MAEPRIAEMTFAAALTRERQRFQTTVKNIADGIGVSYDEYRKYESGETIPDRQTFRRLTGRWPRLRAYRPAWGAADTIDGAPVIVDELAATPPPVQTFGAALRRVREANEITLEQLGEILGVTGQAIGEWEADRAVPVEENLRKLYDVVWELRVAVECGSAHAPSPRDIPKPDGGRGQERVSAVIPLRADPAAAVLMATRQSDEEALVRPTHTVLRPSSREWVRPAPQAFDPRLIVEPPSEFAEIESLGAKLAYASFGVARAKALLAEQMKTIENIKATIAEMESLHAATNDLLQQAIERKLRV